MAATPCKYAAQRELRESPPMVGKGKRSGGDEYARWAKRARQTRYHLRKLGDPAKVLDSYTSEEHDLKGEVTTAIETLCEAYIAWEAKWDIKKEQQCAAGQTPPAPVPVLEWYSSQPPKAEIRMTLDDLSQRPTSMFKNSTGTMESAVTTDNADTDTSRTGSETSWPTHHLSRRSGLPGGQPFSIASSPRTGVSLASLLGAMTDQKNT
jgi:hypothetical protein